MNSKYIFIVLIFVSSITQAEDGSDGEKLFEDKCTACHGISLFSSDKAKITNISGLKKRVNMCQLNVGAKWTDGEITEVTKFLSGHYNTIDMEES